MKKALLFLLILTLAASTACSPSSQSDTSADTTRPAEEESITLPEPEYTVEEAHSMWEKHRQNAIDAFANTESCSPESLSFEEIDAGLRLTEYKGDETIVVIPENVDGKPVLEIAESAFKGKTTLRAVCLPESVTKIDFGAFKGCDGLTTLKLPLSAAIYDQLDATGAKVGDGYFAYVFGATHYHLSASVVPYNLKNVIFTGNATSIPDGAFFDCNDIEAITLPDSIQKIGEFAFTFCSVMEYIDLGSSLVEIGKDAFNECTALLELHIPKSVQKIGSAIVQGCNKLTTITVPFVGGSANENTYLGYIFGAASYNTASGFFPVSFQKLTVLDGCKFIGSDALNSCLTVREVYLPDGLTSIGVRAFRNCKRLVSITLPDSVRSIGDSAFIGCDALVSAELGGSLTTLGVQAFMNCTALKNISLPSTLTAIPDSAFDSCSALESVSFGEGITRIGKNAFRGCTVLTSVPAVSDSVTVMEGNPVFNKDSTAD